MLLPHGGLFRLVTFWPICKESPISASQTCGNEWPTDTSETKSLDRKRQSVPPRIATGAPFAAKAMVGDLTKSLLKGLNFAR